jgi:hypothetical protein
MIFGPMPYHRHVTFCNFIALLRGVFLGDNVRSRKRIGTGGSFRDSTHGFRGRRPLFLEGGENRRLDLVDVSNRHKPLRRISTLLRGSGLRNYVRFKSRIMFRACP